MADKMALKTAIDLLHVPSQVRLVRSGPLPDGVEMLLRIAAGEDAAERTAVEVTGRSHETVRQGAAFFIEQILFASDADSYRVLGADSRASAGELRRNAALLLKWLHPDMDAVGERSIFVGRVTEAWNNLKTAERRATYDSFLEHSNAKKKSPHGKGRSRSGRLGNGKPFANGDPHRNRLAREGRLIRGADRVSLLRRAISVLFHRSGH